MSILTTPERLAEVLIDADESIRAAYHFTQSAIEQLERGCWLIFVEDASFPQVTTNQEVVEQAYSLAYIGHVWNSVDNEFSMEYEQIARRVAVNTITYLLEHPQLQLSNNRGFFSQKSGLAGVQQVLIDRRSAVTLFSRDAVSGEAFWGFTIDLTIREQLVYNIVGF